VNRLRDLLTQFDPISLKEMDSVKLQDRVDTKFMFRDNLLPVLFREMSRYYRVLEIDGNRYNNYETLYFDTHTFDLYIKHHNGKLNRFKFRSRRYVESDLHFFEVKFKNNKGRTIKDRIKRPEIESTIRDKSLELVKSISNIDPATLHPKLWVNYLRMTFVAKDSHERLTIDTFLTFKDEKQTKMYEGLVIAEVKQGSSRDKSHFIDLMKSYNVAQRSISKYCLGVISLHPEIKRNRFKPTLLYLNKLLKAS
jgi:hypothetical protein